MTLAAKTIWQPWYDSHAERIVSAESDSTSSALAKIEAYAARFALIFTLVDNPAADVVDVGAVERGIALADWFAAEAERVYGFFAETEEDREHRRLVEWIERKGGAVTPRDIARSLRAYPTPKDAEAALDALAGAGHGSWEHPRPGERGGHPVRIFRLSTQEATPPCEDADAADVTPPHAAGMAVAPASAPSGPPVAALPGRGTT